MFIAEPVTSTCWKLPGIPGLEAAGVITDTGPGVDHLHVGQRVAYACLPPGAYTSVRTMDASTLVLLPDHIDDRTAAAGLLKGMTAEFLLHRVHEIKPGETILVYAPAGGVGRLLCQWAHRLGATVIGASSSPEKADDALAAGADHVVVPGNESLEEQVRRLTGGNGVDVVYDGIGRDSFEHSVAALAPCGHLVSFGEASGPIPPIDINALVAVSATVFPAELCTLCRPTRQDRSHGFTSLRCTERSDCFPGRRENLASCRGGGCTPRT